MAIDFYPDLILRDISIEPIYLTPIELKDVDSDAILDHTGNPIRDENGNLIYANS